MTMTLHKNRKRIFRERRKKTGEPYAAARGHVLCERAELRRPEPMRRLASALK